MLGMADTGKEEKRFWEGNSLNQVLLWLYWTVLAEKRDEMAAVPEKGRCCLEGSRLRTVRLKRCKTYPVPNQSPTEPRSPGLPLMVDSSGSRWSTLLCRTRSRVSGGLMNRLDGW